MKYIIRLRNSKLFQIDNKIFKGKNLSKIFMIKYIYKPPTFPKCNSKYLNIKNYNKMNIFY